MFESASGDADLELTYSSKSQSAALALADYVKCSEKFSEMCKVSIEFCLSTQSPEFKPQVDVPTEPPVVEEEKMSPEEVKLQQISQLYQYYNSLIIQQD